MLFLKSWLEKYVVLKDLTNAELVEKITLGSSEVESVIMLKDIFDAKVLVGRIENVRNHDNADRLKVFDVNLGLLGFRQIVSAAPNVKEGLLVPVAVEGARLPFMSIAKRHMRGVESQGMCLGKSELMLETAPSEGLYELENDLLALVPSKYTTIESIFGQSVCDVFPYVFKEEVLLDIKVLPNRVSEIGHHLGMAHEISLLCGGSVEILPALYSVKQEGRVLADFETSIHSLPRSNLRFELEDKTDYVTAFTLLQAKITSDYYLPKEYQRQMFLTGRNLVGTIADLSNYFLADFGQPTHIFDTPKTVPNNAASQTQGGNKLSWMVDRATRPREFVGLGNLKNTILPIGTPILFDTKNPDTILSLPAVSGSDSSKTEYNGRDLLVEIANFNGNDVAQVSFDLKYRSDGSRMWSGGVNVQLIAYTITRFLDEDGIEFSLCGMYDKNDSMLDSVETIIAKFKQYFNHSPSVIVDWDYIARRFDGRLKESWLEVLQAKLRSNGTLVGDVFTPHCLFSNISTQNDVLEELIRLIDYSDLQDDAIAGGIISTHSNRLDKTFESILYLKNQVARFGFQEVITRPFVSENHLKSREEATTIRVLKPYNSLMPYVRDNLESSLLMSLSENILRGEKPPLIFEIGLVYSREGNKVSAPRQICLVGVGLDPYLFTSAAHHILSVTKNKQDPSQEGLQSGSWSKFESSDGRGQAYSESGKTLATIKELSNAYKKQFNIPLNKKVFVVTVEISESFPEFQYSSYVDETQFPVVHRSYSYKIEKSIMWVDVFNRLKQLDKIDDTLIAIKPQERRGESELLDILNIDVTFKSMSRTLDGAEIAVYEIQMLSLLQTLGEVETR